MAQPGWRKAKHPRTRVQQRQAARRLQPGGARQCSNKKGYGSKATANGVARVMTANGQGRDGFELRPYKCKVCRRWHVGNRRLTRPTSETGR